MSKYHVHVYRVLGMVEVELEADNDVQARARAIEESKVKKLGHADCHSIAVEFRVPKEKE